MNRVVPAWQARASAQPLPWQSLEELAREHGLPSFQRRQIEAVLGDQEVCWLGRTGHRRDIGLWWRWAPVWFVAGSDHCLWIALRRSARPAPRPWQRLVSRSQLQAAYNPATAAMHVQHPDVDGLPSIKLADDLAQRLCASLLQNQVTSP